MEVSERIYFETVARNKPGRTEKYHKLYRSKNLNRDFPYTMKTCQILEIVFCFVSSPAEIYASLQIY